MKNIIYSALTTCALTCIPIGNALSGTVGQGTWETTLQGRDLDGNLSNGFEAYYDTTLDISWLADANLPKTQGLPSNGEMNWLAANNWAQNLNLGGVTGWRLPTMDDFGSNGCTSWSSSGGSGTDCGYNVDTTASELAHLYYVTLGNSANLSGGFSLTNTGPFKNVAAYNYWSNEENGYYHGGQAWYFSTYNGHQLSYLKTTPYNVWAVHDGDVSPVPEPTSLALVLMGLSVLALRYRRT